MRRLPYTLEDLDIQEYELDREWSIIETWQLWMIFVILFAIVSIG